MTKILVILAAVLALSACTTTEQGAGVGAVTGGIIGAATTGNVVGAAIGAGVGAAAGAVIGHVVGEDAIAIIAPITTITTNGRIVARPGIDPFLIG